MLKQIPTSESLSSDYSSLYPCQKTEPESLRSSDQTGDTQKPGLIKALRCSGMYFLYSFIDLAYESPGQIAGPSGLQRNFVQPPSTKPHGVLHTLPSQYNRWRLLGHPG